jgi:predicted RNA-binding Zn ribbon-like protein
MEESDDFRGGMPFLGGALWIDLLNTTPVIDGVALDLIKEADGLSRWSALARLPDGAAPTPAEHDAVLDLRDLLRKVFAQLAQGEGPAEADRLVINGHLSDVQRRRHVLPDRPATETEVRITGPAVAARVADDFADFLAAFEPGRLRHCDNPACTMVFYDRGKNNRRRWCSMAVCGNRHKVASYRARKAIAAG